MPGSGSGLRFLAGSGSGFNEYGSETLLVGYGLVELEPKYITVSWLRLHKIISAQPIPVGCNTEMFNYKDL